MTKGELSEQIWQYLNSFDYGEVIITKHCNKFQLDIKVRDRKLFVDGLQSTENI